MQPGAPPGNGGRMAFCQFMHVNGQCHGQGYGKTIQCIVHASTAMADKIGQAIVHFLVMPGHDPCLTVMKGSICPCKSVHKELIAQSAINHDNMHKIPRLGSAPLMAAVYRSAAACDR